MLRFMIILPVYTTRTKSTKKARSEAPFVQICTTDGGACTSSSFICSTREQQPQLQQR